MVYIPSKGLNVRPVDLNHGERFSGKLFRRYTSGFAPEGNTGRAPQVVQLTQRGVSLPNVDRTHF
jgi:hypothetical protein